MTDSTAETSARRMGQQLRQAREAAGLDVASVAAKLRMQKTLIQALEEGDWSRLGAPVFVRGHLRSYARLLGIELTDLAEVVVTPSVPVTPMLRSPRGQQLFGRLGTRLVYVVITVLVGVPVWMAAQRHLSDPDKTLSVALEIPESQIPPSRPSLPQATAMPESAPPVAASEPPPPVTTMASLLPPAERSGPPSALDVSLQLNQDSWVELYAPDGSRLEHGLLKAGEIRRFGRGQLGHAVIGNANGATLRIGGKVQDLSPWQRANVARFEVSSDGVIGPGAD